MALQNLINARKDQSVMEDASGLQSVSDDVLAQIMTVALESSCTDEELDDLEESCKKDLEEGAVTEGVSFSPVMERSIVKLDKTAKKQKAYKLAVLHVAKEMDLKEYKQWCTVRKMDLLLMRKMEKRCAAKAKAYMREAKKKAEASTKNPIKKAVNYLTRSQRRTQQAMSGNTVIPSELKSKTNAIASKLGQ